MTLRILLQLQLCLVALVTIVSDAGAQITVHRDSSGFDDVHGRLREIDFEDLYSVTAADILLRNPFGLQAMTTEEPDENGFSSDTADVFLWLGQGATLDFPTRTRRVDLDGYANPFTVLVTDFADSTWELALDTFPRSIVSATGIARLQLLGGDANGDGAVNWSGELLAVTTFDAAGDTLAHTDFDELEPDHYYLMGVGYPMSEPFDESWLEPTAYRGITITESTLGFVGTHLSMFAARVDPDNPIGNLAIEIAREATIDLPEGVEGALLVLETIRERDSLLFEVTDGAGRVDTVLETGWGRAYDTSWVEDQRMTHAHLAFASPDGIRRILLIEAWTTEIMGDPELGEERDTVAYETSTMLAALYLAESVSSEIAAIGSQVTGLDTVGYVSQEEADRLRSTLATARMSVERGERPAAIAALEGFRDDVASLHGAGRLVDEEARLLLGDAAYVVARLGGVASIGGEAARRAGLALGEPIDAADAIVLAYAAPTGARVRIVDATGRTFRELEVVPGSGEIRWDRRDGAGAEAASGLYIVALEGAGARIARPVRVLR